MRYIVFLLIGCSGISPADVQVVELHDCFSTNELITYEALGLCDEGEIICSYCHFMVSFRRLQNITSVRTIMETKDMLETAVLVFKCGKQLDTNDRKNGECDKTEWAQPREQCRTQKKGYLSYNHLRENMLYFTQTERLVLYLLILLGISYKCEFRYSTSLNAC